MLLIKKTKHWAKLTHKRRRKGKSEGTPTPPTKVQKTANK